MYEWTQTHLQDSTDYLYFDNIDLGEKVNKAKFAYNSGDIWFTAVMLRGFIELYQVDKNKVYLNAFNQSLDYAWTHARDEKGLFNTDFSGNTRDNKRWLLTQAAIVEMYARLAAIK